MANIIYSNSTEEVASEDLEGFFVGWPNHPAAATLLTLLNGSDEKIIARDVGGKVVGFITAITDGVLASYIPFLEVLPEYQGNGICSKLVKRMLAKLERFYMIDLLVDGENAPQLCCGDESPLRTGAPREARQCAVRHVRPAERSLPNKTPRSPLAQCPVSIARGNGTSGVFYYVIKTYSLFTNASVCTRQQA